MCFGSNEIEYFSEKHHIPLDFPKQVLMIFLDFRNTGIQKYILAKVFQSGCLKISFENKYVAWLLNILKSHIYNLF